MSKLGNTLTMLKILESGKVYKISELAQMLECSERSVRTYKEDLEKAGIYIDSIPGKYGGYYYSKSMVDTCYCFNQRELNNIENVFLKLKELKFKELDKMSCIIDKIRFQVILSSNRFKKLEDDNTEDIDKKYELISKAINSNSNLEIIYKDRKKCILQPHNIYVYDNDYYITGINISIKQIRTFNFKEIKNLKIL